LRVGFRYCKRHQEPEGFSLLAPLLPRDRRCSSAAGAAQLALARFFSLLARCLRSRFGSAFAQPASGGLVARCVIADRASPPLLACWLPL